MGVIFDRFMETFRKFGGRDPSIGGIVSEKGKSYRHCTLYNKITKQVEDTAVITEEERIQRNLLLEGVKEWIDSDDLEYRKKKMEAGS